MKEKVEKPRIKLPLAGQLRDRISFSELGSFKWCQWKWLLEKVFGLLTDEKSIAMSFGSAIHHGMEILYSDDKLDSNNAAEKATNKFKELLSDMKIEHESDKKEVEKLYKIIPNIFRDVLLCEDLIGIKPIKSELKLLDKISRNDGLDLSFKGYVDFIFVKKLKIKSVIYIADFKTCTWGWPAKKLQDPEVCAQLLLYKHFFCKLTGADPKNVTLAFILLKKTPAKGTLSVEVEKIPAGPKAIQEALNYLQNTITQMHSYEYEQNTDSCIRKWKDAETKEERTSICKFLNTEYCNVSVE